jgi:hypothetical protein
MINQDGWQNISHVQFLDGIPWGYEENHKILSQKAELKLGTLQMQNICIKHHYAKPLDKYDSKFNPVFKLK